MDVDVNRIADFLFSAGLALLTVSATAILARETYFRQERCRLLIEIYSGFFAAYMHWLTGDTPETAAALLASIQRARTFCPEETDLLFEQFTIALQKKDRREQGRILAQLRQTCHDDVEQITGRKRKHRARKGNQHPDSDFS